MNQFRPPSKEALWQDEFSIQSADERYVNRRQFTKFLVLTSLGMFVGNLWILVKSWFYQRPDYPVRAIAKAGEVPTGGVKLFSYPTPADHCILVHGLDGSFAAYSQKCTHLSCAVYYSQKNNRLECPCHEGYFSVKTGQVLQGPPPRPLPRVVLRRKGEDLVAVAMENPTED